MRFRMGMAFGFGAGYYLGAKAGRQRYEQLNDLVRKATRSETFETVSEKARSVVDVGVERARDVVDARNGNGAPPAEFPDVTPPLRP